MTNSDFYLPGDRTRGRLMRMDAAGILKRFFFLERALIISQSAWLPSIAPFAVKTTLPRFTWQDAMTADALRDRVYELRYPNRLMEVGGDAPLIELYAESINAPNPVAFVLSLARVYKPALLDAYRTYLEQADELADGPTIRFLTIGAQEKQEQIRSLERFARTMMDAAPQQRRPAEQWVAALEKWLARTGGVRLEAPAPCERPADLPGRTPFQLAQVPARDDRFHLCRYYWPDILIEDYAYGSGLKLQLRSAISHVNEVWAVETGGAILHAFADQLGWEFIHDAARWTYDEARHTRMGYERLRQWGFEPDEIPLGSYIYDSASGQDEIYRLGMLHYFETKNIGKKTARAREFASYEDKVSQHDMDFDWADETIHAHYGRRWHETLRKNYPERIPPVDDVHWRCDELVAAEVDRATEADREDILRVAEVMIEKANRIAQTSGEESIW